MTRSPLDLAEAYLLAVRRGDDPAEFREALAGIEEDALAATLDSREAATAFWLDVYNASVQHLLDEDPSLWEKRWLTRSIFAEPLVTVAGRDLSLDDVEHGILRGSMTSWGFGYVPRLRPSAFEKRFRLDAVDPRIHFALNCGAASCPPVAVYTADGVDSQLDLATESFLASECEYDPDADHATVSRLFLWYRGDFGGKAGVRSFLQHHGVVPEGRTPSLSYRDYDWSLKLGTYAHGAEQEREQEAARGRDGDAVDA
jgi:hypothetical protein